ncbi:MAG TPA: hypothetical protein VHZ24_09215 [Pirellulales bacterium]|nr:hypothetical protein [Pirellulales bacterium]
MAPAAEDLFWTAFRYVADELPAEEAEQFDERLAADQTARDAVARVVELSAAVAAMPGDAWAAPAREPSIIALPLERRGWMQPVGWMSLGVAAALAVMLAIDSVRPKATNHRTEATIAAAGDGRTLALAWYRTQDAVPTSLPDEPDVSQDVPSMAADASIADGAAPSWLLAAMSGQPAPSTASPEN